MGSKTIKGTIRSNISERLRPFSVVNLDRLTEVLADTERRLRNIERIVLPKSPVVNKKKREKRRTKKKHNPKKKKSTKRKPNPKKRKR